MLKRSFKQIYKGIVKPFLPAYYVEFSIYNVVPGLPVSKNVTLHDFEKGASKEATEFYNKVVQNTQEFKVLPSEIHLKKGKRVIMTQTFGPIDEIKTLKQA
ncbi:hypothetical protein [Flexithrix dorotheae]|uniref:hypothetical protein n=1 Tax=Flexithrix dorotheae TaxID=70993 RepID=UPI0003640A68|nr:hypothetical protein [Flexithrix dorotheae]